MIEIPLVYVDDPRAQKRLEYCRNVNNGLTRAILEAGRPHFFSGDFQGRPHELQMPRIPVSYFRNLSSQFPKIEIRETPQAFVDRVCDFGLQLLKKSTQTYRPVVQKVLVAVEVYLSKTFPNETRVTPGLGRLHSAISALQAIEGTQQHVSDTVRAALEEVKVARKESGSAFERASRILALLDTGVARPKSSRPPANFCSSRPPHKPPSGNAKPETPAGALPAQMIDPEATAEGQAAQSSRPSQEAPSIFVTPTPSLPSPRSEPFSCTDSMRSGMGSTLWDKKISACASSVG